MKLMAMLATSLIPAAPCDNGRFVLALKRVNGKWLIAADLDAANRR